MGAAAENSSSDGSANLPSCCQTDKTHQSTLPRHTQKGNIESKLQLPAEFLKGKQICEQKTPFTPAHLPPCYTHTHPRKQ